MVQEQLVNEEKTTRASLANTIEEACSYVLFDLMTQRKATYTNVPLTQRKKITEIGK